MVSTVDLGERNYGADVLALRGLAWIMAGVLVAFLTNSYLNFWYGWPGAALPADDTSDVRSSAQLMIYIAAIVLGGYAASRRQRGLLRSDARAMFTSAAFIVRGAFFSVLFVGLADIVISFLRVEEMLSGLVGEQLTIDLGRSQFRGVYVHFPLILLSFLLASVTRTLGFTWLALLVVLAEFQIVISRFVFSYEQAFMGDLVRFWYASLFLFASAHTLIEEGHVRVDVFYAGFADANKARANIIGCLFLGLPLCWTILLMGLATKGSSIASPLTSYEISQSGFGLYTKYLMAGFLLIFAVTMILQFLGYMLNALADLKDEPGGSSPKADAAHGEPATHDIV